MDGAIAAAGAVDVGENGKQLTRAQCRDQIYESLIRSGKMDMLRGVLRDMLQQSGWSKLMRDRLTELIQQKGTSVNFSHILAELTPVGRAQAPLHVREKLREILYAVAESLFTIVDDTSSSSSQEETQDVEYTDPPFIYQPHDTVPDYGDLSILNEPPDTILAQAARSPSATPNPGTSSEKVSATPSFCREIRLSPPLDLEDVQKLIEKSKTEAEERKKVDTTGKRLNKEAQRVRLELELIDRRQEEQKRNHDAELQKLKDREHADPNGCESSQERRQEDRQENAKESLSVPSSSGPDKKRTGSDSHDDATWTKDTESAVMTKTAVIPTISEHVEGDEDDEARG